MTAPRLPLPHPRLTPVDTAAKWHEKKKKLTNFSFVQTTKKNNFKKKKKKKKLF